MTAFFIYLLKASFCLTVYYLFYRCLLHRNTFHRSNRLVILGLFALSGLTPFIPWPGSQSTAAPAQAEAGRLSAEQATQTGPDILPDYLLPAILLVYTIGLLVLLIRECITYRQLYQLIRNHPHTPMPATDSRHPDVTLVILPDGNSPFSWMNHLFLSETDLRENRPEILQHELAHIRAHHTCDLIFANLCCMLQWFNPAAWLLKQALQATHEYEADQAVVNSEANMRDYQLLLIRKAAGTALYNIANRLNRSNRLTDRITMMMSKKSSPWTRVKYLYILPLTVLAMALFARPEVVAFSERISATPLLPHPSGATTSSDFPTEPVYDKPEQMPEFPGGHQALYQFLANTLRFPPSIAEQIKTDKKNIRARSVVRFTISKDGKVGDITLVRSSGYAALDEEAVRTVGMMPDWTPGRVAGQPVNVSLNLPIFFTTR